MTSVNDTRKTGLPKWKPSSKQKPDESPLDQDTTKADLSQATQNAEQDTTPAKAKSDKPSQKKEQQKKKDDDTPAKTEEELAEEKELLAKLERKRLAEFWEQRQYNPMTLMQVLKQHHNVTEEQIIHSCHVLQEEKKVQLLYPLTKEDTGNLIP